MPTGGPQSPRLGSSSGSIVGQGQVAHDDQPSSPWPRLCPYRAPVHSELASQRVHAYTLCVGCSHGVHFLLGEACSRSFTWFRRRTDQQVARLSDRGGVLAEALIPLGNKPLNPRSLVPAVLNCFHPLTSSKHPVYLATTGLLVADSGSTTQDAKNDSLPTGSGTPRPQQIIGIRTNSLRSPRRSISESSAAPNKDAPTESIPCGHC